MYDDQTVQKMFILDVSLCTRGSLVAVLLRKKFTSPYKMYGDQTVQKCSFWTRLCADARSLAARPFSHVCSVSEVVIPVMQRLLENRIRSSVLTPNELVKINTKSKITFPFLEMPTWLAWH